MITSDPIDDACGPAELLERQRAAFLRDGPPSRTRRLDGLHRLRSALLASRRDIEAAVSADYGHRSRHETAIMELATLRMGIDYLCRNLRRFMRPERRHVAPWFLPGRARIEYQPLGVIGILAPWNYPVALALMPLATAIAAGNRAIVKPSEFAPATGALLARLLAGTFPRDEVAVVNGDAVVGAAFAALPFDHLVFTGSAPVARAVMQAASRHLTPLTLELGGKSPVIIARGQALAPVAGSIAHGKLANAGQTCIAPDYALVHESEVAAFTEALSAAVATLYPAGPASDDYTSIINERHHARLTGLLDDARSRGARIVELGLNSGAARSRPHTLAPTAVLGVTADMRIMQEEVFGPVLPIVSYAGIDAAIAHVNAGPRPLALYYFGPADPLRQRVLSRTTSGNVTINGTLLHYAQDDLPFGGIGGSGFGAYHGVEGFRALSHARGIFEQGRWNATRLVRAPFGRLTDLIVRILLR